MNCFHCGQPATGPYVATISGKTGTLTLHTECLDVVANELAQARWNIMLKRPQGRTLKSFILDEVEKTKLTYHGVYGRIQRNQEKFYPKIQLIRINKRVVFVTEREQ